MGLNDASRKTLEISQSLSGSGNSNHKCFSSLTVSANSSTKATMVFSGDYDERRRFLSR